MNFECFQFHEGDRSRWFQRASGKQFFSVIQSPSILFSWFNVGTHQATSCRNMLRRHIAATNRFVCTGEFLWKSLSLQQNFVAATCCKKSNQTGFVLLIAATKLYCRDKDFHKKFSSTHEAICRCYASPRHVASTSSRTCTHWVICRRDLLLQLVA